MWLYVRIIFMFIMWSDSVNMYFYVYNFLLGVVNVNYDCYINIIFKILCNFYNFMQLGIKF